VLVVNSVTWIDRSTTKDITRNATIVLPYPVNMKKRSLFRRLISVEVVGGAVFGAALPYLIALAIKVAPTRVPIGLAALSVIGGAFVGWILLRTLSRYQRKAREAREAQECQERERQEQAARLERLERAIAEITPRRKIWPRLGRQPPAMRR
jgi:hypothetical protein